MNKWEIWVAKVAFEDEPTTFKMRPVLVLDVGFVTIFSAKITSHEPRPNYLGEYQILEWQKAGLKKESTVRLSQIFYLSPAYMVRKIGKLQPKDIYQVEKIIDKL